MKQVIRMFCVAGLLVSLAAGAAFAGPLFYCVNGASPASMGGGVYRFDFELSNDGSGIPVYAMDLSGYGSGTPTADMATGWTMTVLAGPAIHLSTQSNPGILGSPISGFSFYAATTQTQYADITFSNQQGDVFAQGVTMFPVVPEPSSLLALGSCLLALGGAIARRRR